MNGQVQIGREFFDKIKLDYADWRWALAREFLQNCFDAPRCKHVSVNVVKDRENCILTVTNDGEPMDDATLFGKLLTLGGSGKNFDGDNIGGFGVAKSLLYCTHVDWQVRSGSNLVKGSGAQYVTEKAEHFDGTESVVTVAGDYAFSLTRKFLRFASMAQWGGQLTINGEVVATNLHKGARRKDLGWATIYTNKSFENLCIVRLGGQPMFTLPTCFKGTVLLELSGKAKDVLTSNRDGLASGYAADLSNLLTELAVDKRSALREQRAEYKRFVGEKVRHEAAQPKAAAVGLAALVGLHEVAIHVVGGGQVEQVAAAQFVDAGHFVDNAVIPVGGVAVIADQEEECNISIGPEFILKNTTGRKTPSKHVPGEKFSDSSKRLIRAWTAVLLKLHQLRNASGRFSVGFVFDDEHLAECERNDKWGLTYYINPTTNSKDNGGPARFVNRFSSVWGERHVIISEAAHEFVHGQGFGRHDEDYAAALTDVMATCLQHSRANWRTAFEGLEAEDD